MSLCSAASVNTSIIDAITVNVVSSMSCAYPTTPIREEECIALNPANPAKLQRGDKLRSRDTLHCPCSSSLDHQPTKMSTYEDEHNLNRTTTEESEHTHDHNHARRPTLQQALDNFLNTPTYSTSNIVTFNRDNLQSNGIPIDPQMMEMLQSMLTSTNGIITMDGSSADKGVDDSFMDTLERVNVKTLKDDDTCPICTNDYKSDQHPLVVELPCNSKHRFDLECIGPWLKLNKTCPLCRTDVTVRKNKVEIVDSEEEEEGWDMYG